MIVALAGLGVRNTVSVPRVPQQVTVGCPELNCTVKFSAAVAFDWAIDTVTVPMATLLPLSVRLPPPVHTTLTVLEATPPTVFDETVFSPGAGSEPATDRVDKVGPGDPDGADAVTNTLAAS